MKKICFSICCCLFAVSVYAQQKTIDIIGIHQLVDESISENKLQVKARNKQALASANEQSNLTLLAKIKVTYRQIQQRYNTLGTAINLADIGFTASPMVSRIISNQAQVMDSINKQNDPAYKAEQLKKLANDKAALQKASEFKLRVVKADESSGDFNTVKPPGEDKFITAVIDENVTGYAGSRLRLKLLEDIRAGNNLIKKGTYIFAQISGFSEQRVTLSINSILSGGKILPVKLEIYDLDGMPGLYVPASAFREFTRDLGSNAVQGVTIDGNSTGNQFIMSSVDKIFQSTSSAIAGLIRKNKAKMKYNSFIYLIDGDALLNTQKSY